MDHIETTVPFEKGTYKSKLRRLFSYSDQDADRSNYLPLYFGISVIHRKGSTLVIIYHVGLTLVSIRVSRNWSSVRGRHQDSLRSFHFLKYDVCLKVSSPIVSQDDMSLPGTNVCQ